MDTMSGNHPGSDSQTTRARQEASELGEELKDTFQSASSDFARRARKTANEQKSEGAQRLQGISRAIHDAADELGHEMPQAAEYVHSAADRLGEVSTTLREKSFEDLVFAFDRFARHRPLTAFAGSVLAGFAVSRFLKSSASRSAQPGQ